MANRQRKRDNSVLINCSKFPSGEIMHFDIEFEQEVDGRWIAEIPSLPGVMVYGATKEEAKSKVEVLALRVTADRLESEQSSVEAVQFAMA